MENPAVLLKFLKKIMIEKKECIVCSFEVIIQDCHYTCKNCGFSENCHDKPHLINDIISAKEN